MFSGVVLSVEFIYGVKEWFGKNLHPSPITQRLKIAIFHDFFAFFSSFDATACTYDTEHTKCPISTTHGFYAKFSIKTSVLDAVKNPGLSSLLRLTITKIIGPLGHRIWSGKNQKVEKT